MIKVYGTQMLFNAIDRAIQVHGALGYTTDLPLEEMYRMARASRLVDGADEVHKVTIARKMLKGIPGCGGLAQRARADPPSGQPSTSSVSCWNWGLPTPSGEGKLGQSGGGLVCGQAKAKR